MPAYVRDVMEILETHAPRELASDWDNIGLQVGDPDAQVKTVLVALDLSMAVLQEALDHHAEMIVVHHPVLFRPLQALHTGEPLVQLLSAAIQAKLAVYAAHTNLDAAPEGVSQVLARKLALTEIRPLPGTLLGRVGVLPVPMSLENLASGTAKVLGVTGLRVFGSINAPVSRVAVCGGSGGDLVEASVRAGAQVLITGDIGYHDLLEARDRGLHLIDAGHAATETPVVADLALYITRNGAARGLNLSCLESRIPAPAWQHIECKG